MQPVIRTLPLAHPADRLPRPRLAPPRRSRTTPRSAPSRPKGAIVLLRRQGPHGWVKQDGKTPADWPVADGVFTVGRGNIMTEQTIRRLQAAPRVQRALHAQGQRARGGATAASTWAGSTSSRSSTPTASSSRTTTAAPSTSRVIPSVNACKPPLQWQTYDVTFHKAVVDARARSSRRPA